MTVRWHPTRDGLLPVSKALDDFIVRGVDQLADQVQYQSTAPSHVLNSSLNGEARPFGMSGRVEIIRRWLQTNAYASDSAEFQHHISSLVARLRKWEERARQEAEWNRAKVERLKATGRYGGLADWFSEELRNEYDAVCDAAAYASDYIKQLAVMVGATLNTASAALPDLTPVQDAIYRVLTDEYQSAVDIAESAKCDHDNCRRELANLKRFGLVDHKSRVGYRRASARAL